MRPIFDDQLLELSDGWKLFDIVNNQVSDLPDSKIRPIQSVRNNSDFANWTTISLAHKLVLMNLSENLISEILCWHPKEAARMTTLARVQDIYKKSTNQAMGAVPHTVTGLLWDTIWSMLSLIRDHWLNICGLYTTLCIIRNILLPAWGWLFLDPLQRMRRFAATPEHALRNTFARRSEYDEVAVTTPEETKVPA